MTSIDNEINLTVIQEEEGILDGVIETLQTLQENASTDLNKRSETAREITSSLVAARNAEEKQLLASDEAVAQGLKERRYEETLALEKQLIRPYFARFEIEEELASGKMKTSEFKLGYRANAEARIVDWRQAPLAKLYYEYQEGDEFAEIIRDREREGTLTLRRQLEIDKGQLKRITCSEGTFIRGDNGTWHVGSGRGTGVARSYGKLPSVLSLITPEQFRLITEDASSAVILQGLAGSGKTTVALHRLSWLNFNQAPHEPSHSTVIVRTDPLKAYIVASLPALDLNDVPVETFEEWLAKQLGLKEPLYRGEQVAYDSTQGLQVLESAWKQNLPIKRQDSTVGTLRNAAAKLVLSEEFLNSDAFVELSQKEQESIHTLAERLQADDLFPIDYALLTRFLQILEEPHLRESRRPREFLVVDEVQDYTALELACIVGAAKEFSDLTLVGDTSQQSESADSFLGWHSLTQMRAHERSRFTFVELEIVHRSTLPIMKLAQAVSPAENKGSVPEGRAGKVPQLVLTNSEQEGVEFVGDWIDRLLEKDPSTLIAVLCRDAEDARLAASLLKPRFRETLRHWNSGSFSLEEGIIITEIRKVKGLEFPSVVLWNPSSKKYTDTKTDRALLYIGISRAEEDLCIVSWQRLTRHLSTIRQGLARIIDLRQVE
jgi:DNA helicase II / ATP-dependent DNA helicase PcrA